MTEGSVFFQTFFVEFFLCCLLWGNSLFLCQTIGFGTLFKWKEMRRNSPQLHVLMQRQEVHFTNGESIDSQESGAMGWTIDSQIYPRLVKLNLLQSCLQHSSSSRSYCVAFRLFWANYGSKFLSCIMKFGEEFS